MKKMKKLLALMLTLLMVMSVAACGSSGDGASDAKESGGAAADTQETANASDTADFGDVANDPQVTLTAASAFTSTQLPGMFWEYFEEQVEELSGGSIQLDLYLGGTLCGPDEEMNMLSNGSLDMMMTFTPANAFQVPTIASIYYTPGSIKETQDVMKYILFEDETSSAAIEADFADNNATLLPSFVVTSNIVFISKDPVESWSDMYGMKFGCPMDANYSDMGFQNLVTVIDSDWYESMRTGQVDCLQVTEADVISSKLYEVANYYVVVPANRVDHWMTINTDKYNSLTDNQKAVLEQACENLLAYTEECQNNLSAEFEQTVADNDGTILNMTDEEVEWFLYCGDILGWKSGLETLAVATDSVEGMTAVQNANKEGLKQYTEYNFDELEAKYAE